MRCTSYCTAASYDIFSLLEMLQKDEKAQLYRNVIHLQKKEGDVFYFSYGVIVCWGFSEKEELVFLAGMKRFAKGAFAAVEIDEFTFDYGSVMKITDDLITLKSKSTLTKFAISHGLAQSLKLSTFEDKIHNTLTKAKRLPDELATKGKISLSRKEISKKMGALFRERHMINLNTEILETPEFFWDHPDLEPFYQKTAHYLEVSKRVEELNKRLDVMGELFEILSTELNHQHSSRLEWTIIILIVIEVIIVLLKDVFNIL